MWELASGEHNILKGTRQHVIPVGFHLSCVPRMRNEVEANLLKNMCGFNQYWYQYCRV